MAGIALKRVDGQEADAGVSPFWEGDEALPEEVSLLLTVNRQGQIIFRQARYVPKAPTYPAGAFFTPYTLVGVRPDGQGGMEATRLLSSSLQETLDSDEVMDQAVDLVPLEIAHEGAIQVSNLYAFCEQAGHGIVLVEIELKSKRAELIGTSNTSRTREPEFFLGASEETLHVSTHCAHEEMTTLRMPGFAGWEICCANLARYTLRVVLRKDPADLHKQEWG